MLQAGPFDELSTGAASSRIVDRLGTPPPGELSLPVIDPATGQVFEQAHRASSGQQYRALRALRQKPERDPAAPELIVNEPAVGYRLVG